MIRIVLDAIFGACIGSIFCRLIDCEEYFHAVLTIVTMLVVFLILLG